MTGIYVILGVVALLVVIGIVQYNKLVRLNVAVDEGFAQIEVQLQRRGRRELKPLQLKAWPQLLKQTACLPKRCEDC